ncbi:MAG: RNase adapter RapZ [Oscillospiraceae bacterium]|nr:RNase adapter RapZ [Oscillospiraceae bacterium]
MQLYVITGMSGAGKSLVVKQFEDMGFYCVDNLPPSLIPKMIEISGQSGGKMDSLALGIDIRGGELLNELIPGLNELDHMGIDYKVLFLEANDKTLIKRYKESRRTHPLAVGGRIPAGLALERVSLESIKSIATWVIDTSSLRVAQLREEIFRIVRDSEVFPGIVISIISFGFKYGLPMDTDLVFDVRFTPNPFYEQELREMTGLSAKVSEYVFSFEETRQFLDKLVDMLVFLVPYYIREGKTQLEVGIGCTGGQHRSVAIAAELKSRLEANGSRVIVEHRDIERAAVKNFV